MACGLALLASGQAFATTYYSGATPIVDADLTNGTKWKSGACGGAAGTGTISMTNADIVIVCNGHSLNLSSATVSAGKITFISGTPQATWGGTLLKFGAGSKVIENYNSSLPTIALNISNMIAANTIYISSFGGNSVTFSSVTGRSLECPAGTPYTAGNPIAANTSCVVGAVVGGGGGGGGATSAPIFSTQEKPAVFSEEVK